MFLFFAYCTVVLATASTGWQGVEVKLEEVPLR